MAALLRLAFRAALWLPAPVLDRIADSGGGAIPGRGADPRARFHAWLVTRFGAAGSPDPVMARRPCLLSLSLLEGPPLSLPEIRDLCLPGPGGPLAARLYTPDPAESCGPALIFLHFGGGVLGDLETCHTACTRLARHGGFRVLSLAYRLAPEHPFPAALEDVIAAWHWLRTHAATLGIDPGAVAIGGDSAGGCLAAAASLALLRAAEPLPKAQILIYPVLEMDREALPPGPCDQCYPLTRADMAWFARLYMRDPADAADPLCSVARAGDLSGMPPTLLVQAGHDLLFAEGAAFAARLRGAGVALDHVIHPTLPHAFSAMTGGVPAARAALTDTARRIRALLISPKESLK
ncbi:alpha/beta hydrolase [Pseudogemmobacter humi]|uniref:Carboxylesterase NlhH n=1 Tax=Pseudogemmobacter humi TaxID=2483812 RepID=A0A3P5XXR9_9RHOB|nr:alpha/beta hydrolase [Pseudogemmobacter humi]VDC33932.1 Carboxylesterase NlhH [Pseudogemmobacter humi]